MTSPHLMTPRSLAVVLGALLLCGAVAPSASAQAWVPPVGIPAPTFGITQTPGVFTHYVDNAGACTDNQNPFGTPGNPRCSVPTSLQAGAVVEVRGGPYFFNSDPNWNASGTLASPIFVRGIGTPGPRFTSGNQFVKYLNIGGNFFIFDNVVLDRVAIRFNGSSMALRNSEVRNFSPPNNDAAIAGFGTNQVVYNNHIHNNGDPNSTVELDIHGVKWSQGSSNLWVVDNHIHDNGGDEVQIGDDTTPEPWPHHVYIGRNVGHGARENCVNIKQARDVIISSNECYDYQPTVSSDGTPIMIQNAPQRVWIVNNYVHDASYGIQSAGHQGFGPNPSVYVIGNLIQRIFHVGGYDPNNPYSQGSAVFAYDAQTLTVVNNTIHNCDAGITYAADDSPTLRFTNNIISTLTQNTHHVRIGPGAQNTAVMNNTIIRPTARIKWGDGQTRNLASFRLAYPTQCATCFEANPGFTGVALTAESAGQEGRALDAALATFAELYGTTLIGAGAPPPVPAEAPSRR